MTGKTSDLGKLGEDLACEYLVKNGYAVLRRNVRNKRGEIDIVAKAKDRTLVFIEVKTMSGTGAERLSPEDHMTGAKLRKFAGAALMFSAKNPDLVDEKAGWRLDLVAIDLTAAREPTVRHYENART